MCCRLEVEPLDLILAQAILIEGQFRPSVNALTPQLWSRAVDDMHVMALLNGPFFVVSLLPTVGSWNAHADKRIAASVMFEIASKYAEKVNGGIWQCSNVMECRNNGRNDRCLIASYPERHLEWKNVCPGFQAVFLAPMEDIEEKLLRDLGGL